MAERSAGWCVSADSSGMRVETSGAALGEAGAGTGAGAAGGALAGAGVCGATSPPATGIKGVSGAASPPATGIKGVPARRQLGCSWRCFPCCFRRLCWRDRNGITTRTGEKGIGDKGALAFVGGAAAAWVEVDHRHFEPTGACALGRAAEGSLGRSWLQVGLRFGVPGAAGLGLGVPGAAGLGLGVAGAGPVGAVGLGGGGVKGAGGDCLGAAGLGTVRAVSLTEGGVEGAGGGCLGAAGLGTGVIDLERRMTGGGHAGSSNPLAGRRG
jgi:hypothetical protein